MKHLKGTLTQCLILSIIVFKWILDKRPNGHALANETKDGKVRSARVLLFNALIYARTQFTWPRTQSHVGGKSQTVNVAFKRHTEKENPTKFPWTKMEKSKSAYDQIQKLASNLAIRWSGPVGPYRLSRLEI